MKKTASLSIYMILLATLLISIFSASITNQDPVFDKSHTSGAGSDSILQQKIDSLELPVLQLAKLDNILSMNERTLDSILTESQQHQILKISIEKDINAMFKSFMAMDSGRSKLDEKTKLQHLENATKKIIDKGKVENELKVVVKTIKLTDSVKNARAYDSLKKVAAVKTNFISMVDKEIFTLIGKTINKHPDTVKGSSTIQTDLNKLSAKADGRSQIDLLISNLEKRKKEIEKKNITDSDEYKKLNKKLEPQLNSVNDYLVADTGNHFLNIRFSGATFRCFLASSKIHIVKIHNNNTKSLKPLDYTWKQLKKEKPTPLAVMNAGMYKGDGSPVGVFIKDAKILNPLETSELPIADNFHLYPNGVFYVDTLGRYFIKKTADFKKLIVKDLQSIKYATQSGPMLLIAGNPNKAFAMESKNLNIRNGIGIIDKSKNTKMVMAISDSKVNFYNFSMLFKYIFGCKDALYMDGAISKMYVKYGKVESGDLGGQLGPTISISKN